MYKLPHLSYGYGDFNGYISKDIMELHYDKHHRAYVDKLNLAVDQVPDLKNKTLEDLLSHIDQVSEPVRVQIRNNGGGHYNHSLFWNCLSPSGGGEPSGALKEGIIDKFGDYQSFVDKFTSSALSVFGSGWVFLQPSLEIITTPNQDTPIMQNLDAPILCLDVWEHAYYLDYKNRRDEYIKSWWNVVNWDFASDQYRANKNKKD